MPPDLWNSRWLWAFAFYMDLALIMGFATVLESVCDMGDCSSLGLVRLVDVVSLLGHA